MSAVLAFFAGPLGRWLVVALMVLSFGGVCAIKGAEFQERRDDAKLQALQHAWDAERFAQAKSVQDQKDRNLALQRHAEEKYVVTRDGQDRFFTTTITEIRHDAAPLAACPVPEPVRVRLNAAAACARGDSAASCGPDGPMPGTQ